MKRLRIIVFVTVCFLLSCQISCNPSHVSYFSSDHLLRAQSGELDTTTISPYLEAPINTDENIVWCLTFQLVWNEMCNLIGEDIHLHQEPPMVEVFNKRAGNKNDIDDKSYVALAGHVRDRIHKRIKTELNRKFKGAACPQLIPGEDGMRPQDIVAYSYLFKNLEFPNRFERLKQPIYFKTSKVSCFGVGETSKSGHAQMCDQVSIFDYNGQDDFIIELATKSPIDQVILAKISPAGTLQATVHRVLKRMSDEDSVNMRVGDILKVPKFHYDLIRNYDELIHKKLIIQNPKIAQDLVVLSAAQQIRFQMDEEGVKLKSESNMSFGCSASYQPRTQHIMVFDKPFLVMLKNKSSKKPYFAMWIQNPELLVPWK
ncbi:MAG: hypothetical protein ABFR90_02725 [Planctomycetota bacterium]